MTNCTTTTGTSISLIRAAIINYTIIRGDSFLPAPLAFTIDDVPEDFSGCTIRLQIRKGNTEILEISTGSGGIVVTDNSLQYSIDASVMAALALGTYNYDVEKTSGSGVVETIQAGTIKITKDYTY